MFSESLRRAKNVYLDRLKYHKKEKLLGNRMSLNIIGKPKHVEDVTASAPDKQKWQKPWTMVGFFAGRSGSRNMIDNSSKVFQAAFKMMDDVSTIAKNSGDAKLLQKVEEIREKWQEMARRGVEKLGVEELEKCLDGGKAMPGAGTPYRQIHRGITNSDVNVAVDGLQELIDPYAKEIYGKSDEYNALENIGEEANQFQNKSDAIMKAPLWRRGLERIWQSFSGVMWHSFSGTIEGPKNTALQLEELRKVVDEVYKQEMTGNGEIGKWFEEYARKSYVGFVLAKARETGSIAGVRDTISDAIQNPKNYFSDGWKEAPIVYVRSQVESLQLRLDKVNSKSDPTIQDINYESIELARAINSMSNRLDQIELSDVLDEWKRNFERNAKRLGITFHEIKSVGEHDFVPGKVDVDELKAEEALMKLRDYFISEYNSGKVPLFQNIFSKPADITDLFERIRKDFHENYRRRKELLEGLIRNKPRGTPFRDVDAPALG